MFPASFSYIRAESVGHALALLEEHGADAKLLAGGHSLIPAMKLRLAQPAVLIDVGRLRELQYIRAEGDMIAIGALTTHHQLDTSSLVQMKLPALAQAAAVVADVQVRNKGTIGGVLAHADPNGDYTAVMLALDAEVIVANRLGTRMIPIADFFTGPFGTALMPGEILAEIRIPARTPGTASVYRKFSRRANDYGMVGVAVFVGTDRSGLCHTARVALTCVSMVPYRAAGAEAALLHEMLTPERIEAAASHVVDGVDVSEDAYISATYRSHLAQVETRRALEAAVEAIWHG
jgi:carbon-monoxide dehydrogenase medium subunit